MGELLKSKQYENLSGTGCEDQRKMLKAICEAMISPSKKKLNNKERMAEAAWRQAG